MIKYRVFPKIFKIFETLCSESPHLYLSPAVQPPTKRKKFSCNIMGKRFCSILTQLSTTATFFKRFFLFLSYLHWIVFYSQIQGVSWKELHLYQFAKCMSILPENIRKSNAVVDHPVSWWIARLFLLHLPLSNRVENKLRSWFAKNQNSIPQALKARHVTNDMK